ncbi:Arabinanase/levansucrase/invertase [Dichomitus squalens LYAD-421 SS1]|uniref:Arabinanase/levansucrase/invertase n=1 Tax=Dichomitus squalens (strain LYAD-421) TaxID=732165 RepID=R7SUD4_DICSQ|nr:Arabinanase/levansucrase/invertase [Dichomitus squalens LYAD-421 SS1]EJF59365.1 Arabinanase/levansucrase/invertase [Dichomitus squalens LYAD-421 SS1]
MMFPTTLFLTLVGVISTLSLATPFRRTVSNGPVINQDFADPGILRNSDGTWYAYSTSSSSGLVPMSRSSDFVSWSTPTNVLSSVGPWADGAVWAPDVREITTGHYVMYYTAHRSGGPTNDHCIGVATATSPAGPFTPNSSPLICDLANGGVIDASGFEAPGGGLYILWKVDGNSIGASTPIKIQHVGANGYDLLGSPVTLITNDPVDGGLVEAPSLVYWDGWYYLFFSSNSYNTLAYDISYAVSQSVTGPFTKVQAPNAPFLTSGTDGTAGPGGATAINVLDQYVNIAFHSDINGKDASGGRAMWTVTNVQLSNGVAKF